MLVYKEECRPRDANIQSIQFTYSIQISTSPATDPHQKTIPQSNWHSTNSTMPHLPFSATSSPSSSPRTSPSPPSIVLHAASGIIDRSDCRFPSNLKAGASSTRELYKSSDDITSSYRTRYAQYLAATFNMSIAAALAEADSQLQLQSIPRKSSSVSEAEILREG